MECRVPCAAETADVTVSTLPAVAECARMVNGIRAVVAAAIECAIVQMVSAVRRVLDFRERRDEVCKIEDVLLKLMGKGEEAKWYCRGSCMVTTYGAESSLPSESLNDRVGIACEADGAACKGAHGGQRGDYALSHVGSGDITDEVEPEYRRRDIS